MPLLCLIAATPGVTVHGVQKDYPREFEVHNCLHLAFQSPPNSRPHTTSSLAVPPSFLSVVRRPKSNTLYLRRRPYCNLSSSDVVVLEGQGVPVSDAEKSQGRWEKRVFSISTKTSDSLVPVYGFVRGGWGIATAHVDPDTLEVTDDKPSGATPHALTHVATGYSASSDMTVAACKRLATAFDNEVPELGKAPDVDTVKAVTKTHWSTIESILNRTQ